MLHARFKTRARRGGIDAKLAPFALIGPVLDWRKAEEKILARPGGRARVFAKKAENFLKVDNHVGAKSVLREALSIFPDNVKLLHLAGRTANHLGDYRAAVTLLKSSVENCTRCASVL